MIYLLNHIVPPVLALDALNVVGDHERLDLICLEGARYLAQPTQVPLLLVGLDGVLHEEALLEALQL